MKVLIGQIKSVLNKPEDIKSPKAYRLNIVKEFLQLPVLKYIYDHEAYSELIFCGGSCLRICFGLPRLSEDLDFDDVKGKVKLGALAKDLKEFFKTKYDIELIIKEQKFRIYLKFPILRALELADTGESDRTFVKIETNNEKRTPGTFSTQITPIFQYNTSLLVKHYDLETLMAGKMLALLERQWVKKDKTGQITISVKGRDYFDLIWFMEKGIRPNMKFIGSGLTEPELWENISDQVEKVDTNSIKNDLLPFSHDISYVKNLATNYKEIYNGLARKYA